MVRGWRFRSDRISGACLELQKTANVRIDWLAQSKRGYSAMGTYTIVQSAAQCCSSERLEQHWSRVNAELQLGVNCGHWNRYVEWGLATCWMSCMQTLRHARATCTVTSGCTVSCNIQFLSFIRTSASRGPEFQPRPRHGLTWDDLCSFPRTDATVLF